MSSSQVAEHYNAVPDRGIGERTQSRIFYLRNFNNWMKSEFLQKLKDEGCSNASVLDLACGKGGDLLKWKVGEVGHVVLADIADVSMDQCRKRYEEMAERAMTERRLRPLFDAEFIIADCSKALNERFKAGDGQRFDLCSCQFSLHYAFASIDQARQMLRNACCNLRPGGFFIGTLPDADRIVHILRRSSDGRNFSNAVCSIEWDGSEALFGATFHFTLDEVVNCPEFLVHFPLLKILMDELDMELVYEKRFDDALDYFLENGRDGRGLMGRMQALEPFPADEDVNLVGENQEYRVAEERREQFKEKGDVRKLGTLSTSEWQVACLYRVFAFRKRSL